MKFQMETYNEKTERVEYWEYEILEGHEYTDRWGRHFVVGAIKEETGLVLVCENGDADNEEAAMESDLINYFKPVAKYDGYGRELNL